LSKRTERVIKLRPCIRFIHDVLHVNIYLHLHLRLADYLSANNLLNSFQFAYIKHYSTETTLLSVHDHNIIKAMSHQQITCLKLLDLSAAYDAIDHSILLERLSS